MPWRRLRFGIRSLMILVAVVAIALFLLRSDSSRPGPRYRLIEVFDRNPDGSIGSIGRQRLDLDDPADDFHGTPDGETRFREIIARLNASKAEYRVTSPRGFRPNGDPIY